MISMPENKLQINMVKMVIVLILVCMNGTMTAASGKATEAAVIVIPINLIGIHNTSLSNDFETEYEVSGKKTHKHNQVVKEVSKIALII